MSKNTLKIAEIPSEAVLDMLATTDEKVPEIFTRETENGLFSTDPSAHPWPDCPVIDLSSLLSPSLAEQELSKLHSALVTWGSFQLVNHGIRSKLLKEVREVNKGFLGLPKEERNKCLRGPKDPEGYGNDTVLSQNVPHNWNDRLCLILAPENQRRYQFWPQTPPSFREILNEFTMKIDGVNKVLVQLMAKCIGLEENGFTQEYGEEISIVARINYYPRCPTPDLVRASRAHSDASGLTLMLQDEEVEGLQVLKDDKWFKVPIIPDALFVNVGDQMEIMSNGKFKSRVHRVVANSGKERMSIAMFCLPDPDKQIGPLKQLVSKNNPPLYKTVTRYVEIFARYHPFGERPIMSVKI